MRNLLALLGAALLTFGGLGWYLDWYHISKAPASQGHTNVSIDLNSVKIQDDVHKGFAKGEKKLNEVLEKDKAKTVTDGLDQAQEKAKAAADSLGKLQDTARSAADSLGKIQDTTKDIQKQLPATNPFK